MPNRLDQEQVLAMNTIDHIRGLTPSDYDNRRMSPEELRHIGEVCQAIWFHSGDNSAPHAELTSGKCSDGFVDTLRILRFSNLCTILAEQLARVIRQQSRYNYSTGDHGIGWVVGSDHAGAVFSHEVARLFNTQHDFTEKGPNKTQEWKRFTIDPDELILQVEELVTTTGTLQAVRDGIRAFPEHKQHPVKFADVVATLVHRSTVYEFEDAPILHFVHYDIAVWEPDQCPLCKAGSPRIKPKAGANWALLTGKTAR
jgi:orotate phosphoribosyltransferase